MYIDSVCYFLLVVIVSNLSFLCRKLQTMSMLNYSCMNNSLQDGSVPFHVPLGPQTLSDDPPISWYPGEQL